MGELYFQEEGFVSLWVGREPVEPGSTLLMDAFRIEYPDPDEHEFIVEERLTPIGDLVAQLSYFESFREPALRTATAQGVDAALWVLVAYNYAYDLSAAGIRDAPREPVFLGKFPFQETP